MDSFGRSMPEAYRLRYGNLEIAEHARIVRSRGDALVHVARCPREPGAEHDAEWICVVTDDRPGLLSLLSAAISAHSLDILAARIYCRARDGDGPGEELGTGTDEAVDFFAVRPLKGEGPPLSSADLVAIGLSIENLLRGETDVEWLERRASPTSRPPAGAAAYVHFHSYEHSHDRAHGAAGEGGDLLVVESKDRPGLLLTITLALYQKGLTIVRSNVVTVGSRARDEFELVEATGARLSPARKDEVVDHVQEALARTRKRSESP